MNKFLALAILLLAAGAFSRERAGAKVIWRFRSSANLIVAQTDYGWMLVDTGSSRSVTALGSKISVADVRIETYRPESHTTKELQQLGRDLGLPIRGVVGQDVLRHFTRIEIDYRAETITLHRDRAHEVEAGLPEAATVNEVGELEGITESKLNPEPEDLCP